MKDLAVEFGRNLARARRFAGYSRKELAERSGLHDTEIGLLERGLRKPKLNTLLKLLGGLQIGADELLKGLRPEKDWRA